MASQENLLARYSEFRPAWKAFTVYIFAVVVFLFGPMVNPDALIGPALGQLLATCFAAFIIIKRFTSVYHVTSTEVSTQSSLFKTGNAAARIENIRRVDLRRGLSQRMIGVSHVWIYEKGKEEPSLKLFGVEQPEQFRDLLIKLGAENEVVTGAWRR